MKDAEFGKQEQGFLAGVGFANFISDMKFAITPADTGRPDVMFCRIGLEKTEEQQVRTYLEGDHRLFARFFECAVDTPVEVLIRACAGSSLEDRRRMLAEMPALAERHEIAWAARTAASADIIE